MAKEKKLIRREVYNKKTDSTELRFYDGRKRATDKQVKEEIKANWQHLSKDHLSKEDAAYLGRVKGGHKRQQQAVRIDGKYVAKAFIDNPDNPIQWEAIAQQQGYNNVQQLFNNDKELYEKAREDYYSPNGLSFQYTSDTIQNYVDTFSGKIVINGKPVTKLKALVTIDNIDKAIKRKFGSFFNEYNVSYKHGYTELHIELPNKAQIAEAESPEDLEEHGVEVGYEQTDEAMYERQLAKWASADNAPDEDKYLYQYKVKEKTKSGQYRTKVKTTPARSITEAKVKIREANKKNIVINIERIKKPVAPKKKKR